MSRGVEAQQFAAFLRMFKNRVDRSYEALARRSGVSSSSLHRYCNGSHVPTDYGMVQRFARECGATPPELRELHRLWALADAARHERPEATAPTPGVARWVARPRLVLGRTARGMALLGVAALALTAARATWRSKRA